MRQQLFIVPPFSVLFLQTFRNKVLKITAELIRRQSGRIPGHHLFELLERRAPSRIRELARSQLDERNAETPHVRSNIVLAGVALGIDPLRLKTNNLFTMETKNKNRSPPCTACSRRRSSSPPNPLDNR